MKPSMLLPAVALALLSGACADPAPPAADPAEIERLVASLDPGPDLSPGIEKKLRKADRVAGTVARIAPEKIDPDVAMALVAR